MDLKIDWTGYEAGVEEAGGSKTYWIDGTASGDALRVPSVRIEPKTGGVYHLRFVPRTATPGESVSVNGREVGTARYNETPASEWGMGPDTDTVTTALVEVSREWVESLVAELDAE